MKSFLVNKNYRVYFLNHDYFAQDQFETFTDAVKYAKSKGFEASIYDAADNLLAFWGPIGGLKSHIGYRDISGRKCISELACKTTNGRQGKTTFLCH